MKMTLFKYFFIGIICLYPFVSTTSKMDLKIQPKDSTTIQERTVTSASFQTRADSSSTSFLIFFDKDPQSCDQQAYINIATNENSLHKGRYENISGNTGSSQPFLDFYYTEPNGLRYHCLDNNQTGFFEITELGFNSDREVNEI